MMSVKERWIAAINMKPVDRLPFWPKLSEAYGRVQESPYRNMSENEIHDWIGSDKHVWIPSCIKEIWKNSYADVFTDGFLERTVYNTKYGSTETVKQFDKLSQSWHPVKMPVYDIESLRIMTEWFSDCTVELDVKKLGEGKEKAAAIGETAVVAEIVGKSPLMLFVEWLAGVENANYLMLDYPGEAEELFNAIHNVILRKSEILAEKSVADILYFMENTSTTLISPSQYRNYCYRYIEEYGNVIKGSTKCQVLHMCGHLKALLPDLSKLPARAFEAFTSPTLGNTTLLDGRIECPDKCLIGGTNASLWLQNADEIISQLEKDLGILPHHRGIVISSAGVMPPACKPETIKKVSGWVKNYKPIV